MATRKKKILSNAQVAAFNTVRDANVSKKFSYEELKTVLKGVFSVNRTFVLAFTNGANPPILRVERGRYAFNAKPVYKDRLQTAWNYYIDYATEHNGRKVVQTEENKSYTAKDVENAIAFLKKLGYRVLKPITRYEEI